MIPLTLVNEAVACASVWAVRCGGGAIPCGECIAAGADASR